MKTYIVNQNGKLIVQEKSEIPKKISKFIPLKSKLQPQQQQQQQQQQQHPHPQPQKSRSLVEPPLTEPLKNTNILRPSQTKSQQSGGKKPKASELQLDLFSKLCKIINIDSTKPLGTDIPFEKLQDNYVIQKLYEIQDKLKHAFPSSKLTSLHTNAIKKQSFPGVNIVRQIFKEMGYKLRPINTSNGYVGSKKILRRVYHIEKL